nr:hypothetical protein [uncultured Holophaga sp.]
MKRWIFAVLLGCLTPLLGQAPAQQEVVLSATAGSTLGIAVPAPKVTGVDPDLVEREFHQVLQEDLADAGPFTVIRKGLPASTAPAAYPEWVATGSDWLLLLKVTRRQGGGLEARAEAIDTRPGKPVYTKTYGIPESALRFAAHTISDDLVARLTGERGVAASKVVFARQTSPGVKEIFQIDRDGARTTQLTFHQSLTISPSVAPDGRLAYVTYKGGYPAIWGQRKPGGPHEKLYPVGSQQPQGPCFAPAWSPDGKRLAFAQGDRKGNSDIMVLDLASGRVRRLTDSDCINTEPSWNPSGNQIAFTSDRAGGPQVFLMLDDGSNVRRLTREGTYNTSPCWSPGGGMIAYVSRFEGKFDLFVYKLGEDKAYQITTGIASSEGPTWSPDERGLVFSSGSRGGMQLFTTDLSGNRVKKLTLYAGCQSPKWVRSR